MNKLLLLFSLFLLLSGALIPREAIATEPSGKSCLYHTDITYGKFHIIGYLSITYTELIHSHDDHGPDKCPVDTAFLGTYYRVVCGNKGGNLFFDLLFRPDKVQAVYWGPALSHQETRRSIEDQINKLISALSDNHMLPLLSVENDALDLRMKFTLIPDSNTR